MTYFDLPTGLLETNDFRLEYLLNSSLRIARLVYKPTGVNIFAETPDFTFTTDYGKYYLRGGHRLWISPETWDLTYAEENKTIQVEEISNGVILRQNGTTPRYIYKEIYVQMDPGTSRVHLLHSIRNDSTKIITCAPWGLTMLAPGGTAILPLRKPSQNPSGLLPDRNLVLWPYTKFNDPRLDLRDDVVFVHTNNIDTAFKLGMYSPTGWMAYLYQGVAFIKRTTVIPTAKYPDHGCNTEMYTNGTFVELESLGGLKEIKPGESVELEEDWEVKPFAGSPGDLFTSLLG